jgi:hypothetical protein
MGWIISAGKLKRNGFEPGRNADVITSQEVRITSTPCPALAQWRFGPNTDRNTSIHDGESRPGRIERYAGKSCPHLSGQFSATPF